MPESLLEWTGRVLSVESVEGFTVSRWFCIREGAPIAFSDLSGNFAHWYLGHRALPAPAVQLREAVVMSQVSHDDLLREVPERRQTIYLGHLWWLLAQQPQGEVLQSGLPVDGTSAGMYIKGPLYPHERPAHPKHRLASRAFTVRWHDGLSGSARGWEISATAKEDPYGRRPPCRLYFLK
jgi:hypothetical protein